MGMNRPHTLHRYHPGREQTKGNNQNDKIRARNRKRESNPSRYFRGVGCSVVKLSFNSKLVKSSALEFWPSPGQEKIGQSIIEDGTHI